MNGREAEIPPHKLIGTLRGHNLLPAIVFLPTRRKCDEAASATAGDKSQKNDPEKAARRLELFLEFAKYNPEIKKHKHAQILVNAGIASHHAGHIPIWKLVVEKMMSGGLLNAIFATSTVAAGVDFPARTVVITNADTRGNEGWRALTASELQQMTGRAGRRGKDNVGFVVLAPGQFQNPRKIAELLRSQPDVLQSKFRATYTSILNLLDAFGSFAHLRSIVEKSFSFQHILRQVNDLKGRQQRIYKHIETEIADAGHDLTLDDVLGFERLISSRNRLHEKNTVSRAELRRRWLEENVRPGRIVTQGRSAKRHYLVIGVYGDTVSAMGDDGTGRKFPLSKISRIHDKFYKFDDRSVETAFMDALDGSNEPIAEPQMPKVLPDDGADALLEQQINQITGGTNSDEARNVFLWEMAERSAKAVKISRDIEFLQNEMWQPFENRAKVLEHFNYLDIKAEKVTPNGKWLADLRIDRPLLVGQALEKGIFDGLSPKVFAGLMASLTADSDRNYGDLYLSDDLLDAVAYLEDLIAEVSTVERKYRVPFVEELNLSAAAAAENWADGYAWDKFVAVTKAEEGDLVRLISRTGEALMQIAHLKNATPATDNARTAAEILLREPVR